MSSHRKRIMYIERKAGELEGTARIERVTYSKSVELFATTARNSYLYKGLRPTTSKPRPKRNIGFPDRRSAEVTGCMVMASLRLTMTLEMNIGRKFV